MQNKYDHITIALAGIVQSLTLAKTIAQTGKVDEAAYQTCIHSLFTTQANTITDIYGDANALQLGLEQLLQSDSAKTKGLSLRHILSIIRLQKRIARSPQMLTSLAKAIEKAKQQANYFSGITHPTVIANLGETYIGIISSLRFRFFIAGNKRFLSIRENIDKIRTLLLAALRFAFLWRQMGGSSLQFLFSNNKIKASAKHWLDTINKQQGETYVGS